MREDSWTRSKGSASQLRTLDDQRWEMWNQNRENNGTRNEEFGGRRLMEREAELYLSITT